MYSVRVAKSADAKKIARVHVKSCRVSYRVESLGAILDRQSIKRREAFWGGRLEQFGGTVFVIESDDVVGFCDLVPSRDKGADPKAVGEIAAVYIRPDYLRIGAGRALCSQALIQARKQGYKAVTLWVLASNSGAMRFYESLGFARDGAFKTATATDGSNLQEWRYRVEI